MLPIYFAKFAFLNNVEWQVYLKSVVMCTFNLDRAFGFIQLIIQTFNNYSLQFWKCMLFSLASKYPYIIITTTFLFLLTLLCTHFAELLGYHIMYYIYKVYIKVLVQTPKTKTVKSKYYYYIDEKPVPPDRKRFSNLYV